MMFSFSDKSKQRMSGVRKELRDIADLAIQISIIDFGIPEYGGRRFLEEQERLFKAGLSKADGINNRSEHQSGNALDFYAYVDGKASWDEGHLALVACAFYEAAARLGYLIQWGGLWKSFKDMPHVTFKGEY